MKTILKWLFKERMEALEEETRDWRWATDERLKKQWLAEEALCRLGYELVFVGFAKEQPSEVTFTRPGWILRKVTPSP